ncbi:MAG TPA: oligopeptidase B, partial [Actinomycetes bacterium]
MPQGAEPAASAASVAPIAPREPTVHELHGIRRVDDYYWLRDLERPETLAYLRAERRFYDARMAHTRPLRELIFDEMTRRTVPTDRSVRWMDRGSVYYTQTVAGKEYEQLFRVQAEESTAEMLLDENLVAGDSSFCEIGVRTVSPDGRLLAYSVDLAGSEVYELRFRDLRTGSDLADVLPRTYYGAAWSADSAWLFYVVSDDAYRPYQVWRHRVGTEAGTDVLVLEEADDRFELIVEGSRSGGYIVISTAAKDSSEVWLVPADRPETPAFVVEPRRPGVLYSVSHAPVPDGDRLVIVTDDEAQEFRLMSAPVSSPGRASWTELVGEDAEERLMAADVFAEHVVLTLRRG